jgi:hypothetical protein
MVDGVAESFSSLAVELSTNQELIDSYRGTPVQAEADHVQAGADHLIVD